MGPLGRAKMRRAGLNEWKKGKVKGPPEAYQVFFVEKMVYLLQVTTEEEWGGGRVCLGLVTISGSCFKLLTLL